MSHKRVEQHRIGRSDLKTSCLGLGCVTFGREIDEETSYRVLDHAFSNGITFFDTGESYGGGNSQALRNRTYGVEDTREITTEMYSSEKILGRWINKTGVHDQLVICTKVSSGASAENIRHQVQCSLDRMGIDRIDVYKIHSPDTQVPIGESLDALSEQIHAGRISVIGSSNFSALQMQEALDESKTKGYARFDIIQPPYSLADRSAEEQLLPLCAREQIAVTSYSPLAAGFLAGKYRRTEERHKFPKGSRFDISPAHADIYFNDHNFRVIEHLRRKSTELGMPMVRLAMAWAMSHPHITAVLVGARKLDHIDNAVAAKEWAMDIDLRNEMSAWH